MGLAEQIIEDMRVISGDTSGFGVSITLISPEDETITTTGFSTKHHLAVDEFGQEVNTKKASVAISEGNLTGYPLRNANSEVDLKGHRVNVTDSTGIEKNYTARSWFPDEKLGLIVIILTDYESD